MTTERGARAHRHFLKVQADITAAIESLENGESFRADDWTREAGGGGRTCVLENGQVIEKAGVNVSCVHGEMPAAFSSQVPGDGCNFFATGISLILHPRNPHVPTVHANFRYIEKGAGEGACAWFGGGSDLTPWILYEEDARHFHQTWADLCARHQPVDFQHLKKWCDEYFYIPHRNETRGIGGIFFDYLALGDHEKGIASSLEDAEAFVVDGSASFIESYLPIIKRRMATPWTEEERSWQLVRRGRYVEFNLIYDRGTTFGLKTGGRVESILVSLPNAVSWQYMHEPQPDSYQSKLIEILQAPRDWL